MVDHDGVAYGLEPGFPRVAVPIRHGHGVEQPLGFDALLPKSGDQGASDADGSAASGGVQLSLGLFYQRVCHGVVSHSGGVLAVGVLGLLTQ